jgi:hypothetical protein
VLKGARALAAVLLLMQIALIVWVLLKQRAASVIDRIAWFGDAELSRLARERAFEKILKASNPLIQE